MNNNGNSDAVSALIALAVSEDLSDRGDITSLATIKADETGRFAIVPRHSGVLSGTSVVTSVINSFDTSIEMSWNRGDGDSFSSGEQLATVSGMLRPILAAERTALNFLQHLCGIATVTRIFVDELARINSKSVIRDTRKTLPGYRLLEKAAVAHGGGRNHRMGLYDSFLIKDNHLEGTRLGHSIEQCRAFDPTIPIEIEVDNLEQLNQVLEHRPDLIMLDNFSPEEVLEAVRRSPMTDFEVSGGVTLENLKDYGATNVKYIAIGALTHSSPALDIGFDAI